MSNAGTFNSLAEENIKKREKALETRHGYCEAIEAAIKCILELKTALNERASAG
jgi:hypothetical protein